MGFEAVEEHLAAAVGQVFPGDALLVRDDNASIMGGVAGHVVLRTDQVHPARDNDTVRQFRRSVDDLLHQA